MRLSLPVLFVYLAVAALVVLLAAPCRAASPLFDSATMMSVSRIRAGMKGTCRTVFSGVEITEFNVEVVGVLPKFRQGADAILVRIVDGPIVEEELGIFGGMSGSPVYIGGRLVGAVAFAWPFGKQPIAGVTPIENMLEALDKEDGAEAVETASPTPDSQITIAGRRITGVEVVGAGYEKPFVDDHTLALQPVMTPMFCAGFSARTVERLADFFERRGLQAMPGPGNLRRKVETELKPGAAVGIQLVSGDFDISSVGTVTYRGGDRILAFGHPAMKLGQTQLPLTTAWVHHVVSSLDFSFRMASGITPVGTLTQDSAWSVAGRVGEVPEMIPAEFEIHDRDSNISRSYRLQVCNDPALRSSLILSCAFDALYAGYDANDEGTVAVTFTVEGNEGSSVSRTNTFAYSEDPTYETLWDMLSAMTLLEKNRFKPQRVSSVKLTAKLKRENRTATIERVWTEQQVARAGEDVILHVLVRPTGEELTDREVRLHMPLELPKGYLRVAVGSGAYGWMMRSAMRLLTPDFNSLETVIEQYETMEQNTQLVTVAAIPTVGLRIGPRRLNNMPNWALGILSAAKRTDIALGYSELAEVNDTPYVLDGMATLVLPTEDRRGERMEIRVPTKGLLRAGGLMAGAAAMEGNEWDEISAGQQAPERLWWARSAFAPDRVVAPRFLAEMKALQPDIPMPDRIKKLLEEQDAETDSELPDEEEEEEEEEVEGAVIRKPSSWLHDAPKDYEKGEMTGIGIRDDGVLLGIPEWRVSATAPGEILWSIAADATGNVYVGEATSGRIFRYDGKDFEPYFDTEETAVSALLAGSDAKLYAGTCGAGKIFTISGKDKGEVFCELPADYVWDIEAAPDGGLFVATGPYGVVYLVDRAGGYSVYADLPQSHVLCLTVWEGVVYAGTSAPGAVYQIGTQRQIRGILDSEENDVAAVVVNNGYLYAATAGNSSKGQIYRIDPGGVVETVYEDTKARVLTLLAANGCVYAGTDSRSTILELTSDEHHTVVYRSKDDGAILCLAADEKGSLSAAGANPGRVLAADASPVEAAIYTSPVLDAERVSRWRQIQWWTEGADSEGIAFQCRSGNTSDHEEGSWSAWSREYRSGERIDVPTARYLQYRAKVPRDSTGDGPELRAIKISYLPANQEPELVIKKPAGGAALRNQAKIEWSVEEPEDDTTAATIYLRRTAAPEWEKIAGPLQDNSYELDTTEQRAGTYELKVTVSDEPSNPGHAREVTKIVSGVRIDNDTPVLSLQPVRGDQDEATATIVGLARDNQTAVAAVSWHLDDSEQWWAAQPADGAYDELIERFTINAHDLSKDAKQIVLRAWDEAGNSIEEKVRLPWVSEEEIEEAKKTADDQDDEPDEDEEVSESSSDNDEAKG